MVPFNVRLKIESENPSRMRYTEINVHGNTYRMSNKGLFTIDSVIKELPYINKFDGVTVYKYPKAIHFISDFGLQIYTTPEKAHISMCQTYINFVCGMCGSGVTWKLWPKGSNPVQVDRNGMSILGSTDLIRGEKWATAWMSPDDSADANKDELVVVVSQFLLTH